MRYNVRDGNELCHFVRRQNDCLQAILSPYEVPGRSPRMREPKAPECAQRSGESQASKYAHSGAEGARKGNQNVTKQTEKDCGNQRPDRFRAMCPYGVAAGDFPYENPVLSGADVDSFQPCGLPGIFF